MPLADLIQEFFKRDLSESELDSLDGILKNSIEDVLRFENGLEKYYLATGLPQPHLPKTLHALPKAGGWGGWAGGSSWVKMVIIVAAGTGGIALWKYSAVPQITAPKPVITAPVSTRPPVKPAPKMVSKPILALPAPVQPGPAAKGDELSVVVDTAKKSLVTVRIVDASQHEIRLLYSGFVEPGHWSFQWDSLLADGKSAPAGDYFIEVQSGSYHQSKKISLKPNLP